MIAKIATMRKLHKDYRMQADSIAEIRDELDRLAYIFGKVKMGKRPASIGHIINAALLHVMGLEESEKRSAIAAGLERLDELLRLPEPEPGKLGRMLEGPGEADPPKDDIKKGRLEPGKGSRPGKGRGTG